jgi:fumarate reductase subunit C
MSEKRPFTRPIASDWWAKPPYRAYTVRELSGLAVAGYGAILFIGLVSLWRGPDSYDAFLRFLKSPFSILLNLALLAGVLYHVVTWFQILPKTMPKLILDGKQVPQERITSLVLRTVGFGGVCLLFLTIGWAR